MTVNAWNTTGVAVVSGAARGIGAAVADALAGRGARVALLDLDGDAVRERAAALGEHATGHAVDVADAAAVEAVVAQVEQDLGPVTALVNVAGVLQAAPVAELDPAVWARTFAVNVDGVFHLSRAVTRRMAQRGAGAVVTVTSNAATVPRAGLAAYCASKAASAMFTKVLGLELAGQGIRCNVVAPGSTDTDMGRALWGAGGQAGVIAGAPESFRVGIPLARVADPTDVADAVLFLLSPAARHITMQELCVDGGATLGA
ncbi:2,3-dihydro-2,3-dihydroxybenzoate dehydrogenase [Crossiella cryophila]|uniref:2,3-dihydro-2,3-dihydroxybenzoate dehydrogenase n=1 Tax=Crossiella cryophila TaxID=43355 RepID=A0A7W7CF60_9PSEU|nr:2,3-dihydro-2,3-dihydroxybenzoate dehydrogenase [Crossiella cryophila]MBB4680024.1 2,3-dihydro-2,3-dihydroxybenzoate dehydrogenase [Crossiella cryophila]